MGGGCEPQPLETQQGISATLFERNMQASTMVALPFENQKTLSRCQNARFAGAILPVAASSERGSPETGNPSMHYDLDTLEEYSKELGFTAIRPSVDSLKIEILEGVVLVESDAVETES